MPDSTKNIKFKTTIDGSEEVKKQFDEINDSIGDTANVADTKLTPAMTKGTESIKGAGAASAGMGVGLLTVIGSMAAIAAVTLIVKKVMDDVRESMESTTERISGLTKALKENWDEAYRVTRAWDDFKESISKWSQADLEESLRTLNVQLKETTVSMWDYALAAIFGGANIAEATIKANDIIKQIKIIKETLAGGGGKTGSIGGGIIDEQRALLESYQILESSAKIDSERLGWQKLRKQAQIDLNELMGKELGGMKDNTAEINRQNKELEKQVALWRRIIRPYDYSGMAPMGDRKGGRGKEGSGGGDASKTNNLLMDEKAFQEMQQQMDQFSQTSAWVFTYNMVSAWENIFGEANSMFEQLMASWASMMFEKLGMALFGMVFNMLGGGVFGAARGAVSMQATAAKYGMGK